MSLSDWERNGWVLMHRTSRHEIRDLLYAVERGRPQGAAADQADQVKDEVGLKVLLLRPPGK